MLFKHFEYASLRCSRQTRSWIYHFNCDVTVTSFYKRLKPNFNTTSTIYPDMCVPNFVLLLLRVAEISRTMGAKRGYCSVEVNLYTYLCFYSRSFPTDQDLCTNLCLASMLEAHELMGPWAPIFFLNGLRKPSIQIVRSYLNASSSI